MKYGINMDFTINMGFFFVLLIIYLYWGYSTGQIKDTFKDKNLFSYEDLPNIHFYL